MSVASRAVGRLFRLPPATTRKVTVERDIDVPAGDGTRLRTDHWAPALASAPTVLIRTPYGRKGPIGLVTGRAVAERGFHVVLQSCRGTFDSGGEFDPLRHERDDGLDAIAWIEKQPWFNGTLFTYGPSYVGFTQWAIADSPVVTGLATSVTASSFREPTYAGGAFSLDTILNWATLVGNQGGSLVSFMVKQSRSQRNLRRAWPHLPLSEVDAIATGKTVGFFQDWLAGEHDDAYWAQRGHDDRVASVTAPVCMVGGWYDIFLPWQLADYARLTAAGARPRLVIGSWSHASRELLGATLREAVTWFTELAAGDPPEPTVRLHVGGSDQWREYASWPPPARTVEWFLGSERTLATAASVSAEPDRFRYDPADPTPSPGGPLLTPEAGRVDNAAVEARADVLVYTSAALDDDVEAIGPVSATIRVRSSQPEFDLFVRVCDVDPAGRSENICDGLQRVSGGDGDVRDVRIDLWPTAYRWRRGHRIRVQLAGGAHPRYSRNTGSGEPLGEAATLRPVDHEVFLDGSMIRLPVIDGA